VEQVAGQWEFEKNKIRMRIKIKAVSV